ncbi:helix-turn-helix transcriptional regulator [uncultured Ruminococcus sp.]|uniref:helix-turn-helix domain-containing protein n=1 Tax=uncultured Ruminococcus sp. TaxID=165186 RepID=UPI0025E7746A|nr:helix-turn-helix transcriptional regulator [uncultured Ruminococcus sp.]
MKFNEKLNEYIEILDCTAKELSRCSGISTTTISRYKNGERVPEINSDALNQLCNAIAQTAKQKQIKEITYDSVIESFLNCSDIVTINKENLRQNFNTLISVLNINISKLCRDTNYDVSTVFRFRNGSRQPSDPIKFADSIAAYVSKKMESTSEKAAVAALIGCTPEALSGSSECYEKVRDWLIGEHEKHEDNVAQFLEKLNDFDLNEYIKAIHFDELKVPSVPFQLPTSKAYTGIKEMMESELDFLKATVLSKSQESVIMYSDMPIEEMSKDSEFPKKWMFGMAMMLKKGLHLNMIHNINRPFNEMMLGLESWIPMYMTGQVSPYYLKNVQNNVFLHFLKVSGTAALSGEAIVGCHSDGRYYLTKNKSEVAYFRKRAEALLNNAHSLMDIYREENSGALNAFLLADSHLSGKRRNILSSLPIYTMEEDYLKRLLDKHSLSESDRQSILSYAEFQRNTAQEILKSNIIEDEIPTLSEEEFRQYPMLLSLSGMFFENDIVYTYDDYLEHLKQTERYAEHNKNYIFKQTSAHTFRNLQIIMHEGKWAIISKGKSPAIHFVIHHPKLRKSIENFIPPVTDVNC